jgi:hypothetical protein
VSFIVQAFPGYTPDDLYAMNIYKLMDRLALAERKLLETGFLNEPIALNDTKGKKKTRRKPKVNLSKLKQEFEQQEEPREWNARKRLEAGDKSLNTTVVEQEVDPDFGSGPDEDGNTVISLNELAYNLDNDPTTESPEEKQMLADAKELYGDYLRKMREGQKIKIKPQDERIAETEELMKRRQKLREQIAKSKKKKGAQ